MHQTNILVQSPLPDGNGACQCERREREAEIDPGPVAFGILRQHEKVGQNPEAGDKSQSHPDKVAERVEHGPNGLALRSADPHRDDEESAHENRAENYARNSQANRYIVIRQRGVRGGLHERLAPCSSPSLVILSWSTPASTDRARGPGLISSSNEMVQKFSLTCKLDAGTLVVSRSQK